MRVLFLDDNKERRERFKQNHIGEIVIIAKTADEAIEALRVQEKFDVVYLDHDLDEMASMGFTPIEKTGEDVVKYMISSFPKEKWPPKVIVHSKNYHGAQRMVSLLRDAGIPAYWCSWHTGL